MKSDIEIQKEKTLLNISEIAQKIGLNNDEIENYGKYKAKIAYSTIKDAKPRNNSKLILISAISPTPAGVGKTTNAIGISDALNKINQKSIVVLRQPSLGPTLGMKGGATGGGYAQVTPMEDINLNFTGDFHAITTANNFLTSLIDNHINYNNKLNLDYRDIKFKRTIDLDDRTLREIIIGLGDKNGFPRKDSFVITAASEVMAIVSMSKDIPDMKERLGRILIGYSFDGTPVFAKSLDAEEPMAVLLKDAIKPNLVQTLENNPAIIHMGPFGNIASGTSSIISIKLAMSKSDLVVTEAGFGADLGAEKFLNIVSRFGEFSPSTIVIMASIQALKYHGGATVPQLKAENINAIEKGLENLKIHIDNLSFFGIPLVVGLNRFPSDTDKEISYTLNAIKKYGVPGILTEPYTKGGEGCVEIAQEIVTVANSFSKKKFKYLYDLDTPVKEKIKKIAATIYRAKDVEYTRKAQSDIDKIENIGFGNLPICFAKTQYSISDNPKLLTLDTPYNINVEEVRLSAVAGYIIPIAGSIMTMPGLPMKPNALNFKIDDNGVISGIE
jgi:formate--tetrahydrofolate ligase